MRKIISIFAALSSLAFASVAHAENEFQTHLEAGAAVPLDRSLNSVYSPGPSIALSALWTVHPNISVGPALNGFSLLKTVTDGKSESSASLWQLGPSVRFQANRKSNDWIFAHVNPWLDVSPMIAATGDLIRPTINVGVGAEGPLDRYRIFWFGPFARYTHMFAADGTHTDVNILQGGFSFSFDSPIRLPRVIVDRPVIHVKKVVVHDVVVKEVVKQVAVAPVTFSEKIFFDANSSTLRWESRDKLDLVARKLNAESGTKIQVQGNASSDGPLALNNRLSQARTKTVIDYLVKHGVDPKRLVADSEGIKKPAASNKSKEGRERNRRVEFNMFFSVSK